MVTSFSCLTIILEVIHLHEINDLGMDLSLYLILHCFIAISFSLNQLVYFQSMHCEQLIGLQDFSRVKSYIFNNGHAYFLVEHLC